MLYRTRLMKELNDLKKLNDPTMVIYANENDILIWYAYLFGPDDTPYSEGIFKIKISIPPSYPVKAPTLHFQTKIFHPNVHIDTGEVCLEVLSDKWIPQWTIESIMRAVGVMLQQPNPDSPLNCDAGNLLRANDAVGYKSLAKYYTNKYAISKHDFLNNTNAEQKKNQ